MDVTSVGHQVSVEYPTPRDHCPSTVWMEGREKGHGPVVVHRSSLLCANESPDFTPTDDPVEVVEE